MEKRGGPKNEFFGGGSRVRKLEECQESRSREVDAAYQKLEEEYKDGKLTDLQFRAAVDKLFSREKPEEPPTIQ